MPRRQELRKCHATKEGYSQAGKWITWLSFLLNSYQAKLSHTIPHVTSSWNGMSGNGVADAAAKPFCT